MSSPSSLPLDLAGFAGLSLPPVSPLSFEADDDE